MRKHSTVRRWPLTKVQLLPLPVDQVRRLSLVTVDPSLVETNRGFSGLWDKESPDCCNAPWMATTLVVRALVAEDGNPPRRGDRKTLPPPSRRPYISGAGGDVPVGGFIGQCVTRGPGGSSTRAGRPEGGFFSCDAEAQLRAPATSAGEARASAGRWLNSLRIAERIELDPSEDADVRRRPAQARLLY